MDLAEMSNVDDINTISLNTYDKMSKSVMKAGFRDGAEAGKDKVFQQGFNHGYAEGFRTGQSLGYLKGLLYSVEPNIQPTTLIGLEPDLVADVRQLEAHNTLHSSSRGVCQLCVASSEQMDDGNMEPLSAIIEKQRNVTNKTLQLLSDTYSNKIGELGIELNLKLI